MPIIPLTHHNKNFNDVDFYLIKLRTNRNILQSSGFKVCALLRMYKITIINVLYFRICYFHIDEPVSFYFFLKR